MSIKPPHHKPPGVIVPTPAPHPKPGLIDTSDLDKPKHIKRQLKRIIASPCNRPPETPAHVDMTFHVREVKTHLEFGAKIRWDEVDEDTSGFEIGTVDRYEVVWRAVDHQGDPVKQEHQFRFPLLSAANPTGLFEFKTKQPNSLRSGDEVVISGCTPTGYNGTWTVQDTDADDDGRTFRVDPAISGLEDATEVGHAADNNPQTHHRMRVKQPTEKVQIKAAFNGEVRNLTAATNPEANKFRYATNDAFTFDDGDVVSIKDVKPNEYNITGQATKIDSQHFEMNSGITGHSDGDTEKGRVYGEDNNSTIFTFELNKPHNQIVNNKVRVTKCKNPNDYDHVWTISKIVDATTLEVDGHDQNTAPCQNPGVLADADDSLFVITGQLPNPKSWEWQAKVRARAGEGCWSAWSHWTDAQSPWTAEETTPPAPHDVTLTFDGLEKRKNNRVTAVVSFTEVGHWEIPGGDSEEDVDRYFVQLWASADGVDWHKARHHSHQDRDNDNPNDNDVHVRFEGVSYRHVYKARARSIDRYNRPGQYSNYTIELAPSDTKPPVPDNVQAFSAFKSVVLSWDDPEDAVVMGDRSDPDAVPWNELGSEEVEYYQVQLDTSPTFNSPIKNVKRRAASGDVSFETEHFKRRYWWRVRSVNESGYKSAWVTAGPVRPSKVRLARIAQSDESVLGSWVDTDNSSDFPLSGSQTNLGKLETNLDPAFAWVDGEASNGTLVAELVTGSSMTDIHAGVIFRRQDDDNFLAVALVHDSTPTTNKVVLCKREGGSLSTLTSATYTVEEETSYTLKVVLANAAIQVYVNVDPDPVIDTTSSLFETETGVGIYQRRSGSKDNGESRYDSLTFTPTGAVLPSVDDDFDRAPTETGATAGGEFRGLLSLTGTGAPVGAPGGLGIAASGQTWTSVGDWSIEASHQPYSFYINAATLPIYNIEDQGPYQEENVPTSSGASFHNMGLGGGGTEGMILYIDRPTQVFAQAWANVMNSSAVNPFNIQCFINIRDNGDDHYGRQINVWSVADDADQNRQHPVATAHSEFIDAGPSDVHVVEFLWAYRQDDSSSRHVDIRNQRMTVIASYAPDYSPSFSTRKRPSWTRWGRNRIAYRRHTLNDT